VLVLLVFAIGRFCLTGSALAPNNDDIMMRYFKLPLIVTGIAFLLALILGLAGATWIHRSNLAPHQKEQRTKDLGMAAAFGVLFVITPFWMYACGKVGKERRQARLQAKAPPPADDAG
jgi:cytochrome bd-type quinol oxidase subunit 2